MAILDELAENIIKGQAPAVEQLTEKALAEGESPESVLRKGLIKGMDVVGAKFKANEFYVPEVLIAARAMKAGMKILRPRLAESGVQPVGRFIVGTVKGDLHDIGKNLVAMMMEGAGFEVIDLGVDVTPEKFVASIKETNAQFVGMSALLTTTMVKMKDTIEAINSSGMRNSVKIVVGGAPLTQKFADEIGADGYAPDAASAVELVKNLLN
ncbi:MAG TPA: corrinoid protein [bacterium]|nr:corrinoid protein [bacterium]HOX86993.1 corrinoid protein [bacterium]HPG46324.1 corrinoid protein [bacterium]HPM98482.1 corrinoid protein [bacterium]